MLYMHAINLSYTQVQEQSDNYESITGRPNTAVIALSVLLLFASMAMIGASICQIGMIDTKAMKSKSTGYVQCVYSSDSS